MDDKFESQVDLAAERQIAFDFAKTWGIELDPPFKLSNVSYVAPTKDGAVLKVSWAHDDESLHEADALELWNGDGAVRLLRRSGQVLLEERVVPGDDLSEIPDDVATKIAIDIAQRLWRPASSPFRPVTPEVARWLDRAEGEKSELVPLARELFAEINGGKELLSAVNFGEQFTSQGHEFALLTLCPVQPSCDFRCHRPERRRRGSPQPLCDVDCNFGCHVVWDFG